MRYARLLLFSLPLLLLTLHSTYKAEAAYRTTNNESVIDIDAVDIAPSMTPTPDPRRSPTPPSPLEMQVQHPILPTPTPTKAPKSDDFFIITLTQSDIDFGVIDPTNPVIRTHDFLLKPGVSNGASLFGYENHPLVERNQFIPDTSCDDGVCNEIRSSLWQNTLTYGFGYRCDTNQNEAMSPCSEDFLNQQFYKSFADVSKKEESTSLIQSRTPARDYKGRLTYKVNIQGTQPKGTYTNSLIFIAAPTF